MSATVTITSPTGSTLELTGDDVNTCAMAGFVRYSVYQRLAAFLGFDDQPISTSIGARVPVVEVIENVFVRSHELTVEPMAQDSRGVWQTLEDQGMTVQVEIRSDYSCETS